jgi:WD40 repeat protein
MHPQLNYFKVYLLASLVLVASMGFAQELKKVSISVKGVTAMSYSPDNNYLILAKGPQLLLYKAGNDTRIKEFNGLVHSKEILALAFNKAGDLLLTGGADKKVKLWSIPEGKMLTTFDETTQGVIGVGFADGERTVIALSKDGNVKAWDRAAGSVIYSKQDLEKSARAFAITRDGKYFAIGGGDEFILLYEAARGNLVKKIEGHTGWVRSLAFSPDGQTLASGGDDKIIFLWETSSGNQLREFKQQGWIYKLEFSGDSKFLAAALEKNAIHFYNVSNGILSLKLDKMNFAAMNLAISNSGQEVASIEEFGNEVHLWNISSLNITPVINFKDTKDTAAPLILVSNPANIIDNKVVVYKDILDLRGIVTDDSGVRSLKINNIETPVRSNSNFIYNIQLAMGENYVSMEVTDVNDNIALKKFIIVRKNMEGEEYVGATAVNHLFVVSINNYSYWPKLNNAVKDGNDLVSVLLSKYNFEFANVTVIKDEQATRTNIYNGLRSLIEKVGSKDNLIIYFSGHGYFDPLLNEGYWIPKEANTNSTGEYVSNTDILKILNAINSQHTFLIADACFSGALFSDSHRGYTDQVEKFKSRWGLASGRLETVSDGAIGSNSPFAKRVLQYLNENDKDKFAISELIQYVKTQVAEDTNQTPIGNPLKALGDEGGEMVLYKKKN